MLQTRKVITIDGLAATGKSSIAQSLAKKIQYTHFSSGLLYRLLGYAVLSGYADTEKEAEVLKYLNKHRLEIALDASGGNVALLDGKDITASLFATKVSEASSKVSVHPTVRQYLLEKQRSIFEGQNIIAEGRDMGTIVFPNADLKFFIEVDPKVRIERRIAQQGKPKDLSGEELKLLKHKMEIEVVERDRRDRDRPVSPTVPAPGAIIINNSVESLTEVVERMYIFVSKTGLSQGL